MRRCVCGDHIPFSDSHGPAIEARLKFYGSGADFGHPIARRKVFICDRHYDQFVELLEELSRDGSPSEDVPGGEGSD